MTLDLSRLPAAPLLERLLAMIPVSGPYNIENESLGLFGEISSRYRIHLPDYLNTIRWETPRDTPHIRRALLCRTGYQLARLDTERGGLAPSDPRALYILSKSFEHAVDHALGIGDAPSLAFLEGALDGLSAHILERTDPDQALPLKCVPGEWFKNPIELATRFSSVSVERSDRDLEVTLAQIKKISGSLVEEGAGDEESGTLEMALRRLEIATVREELEARAEERFLARIKRELRAGKAPHMALRHARTDPSGTARERFLPVRHSRLF